MTVSDFQYLKGQYFKEYVCRLLSKELSTTKYSRIPIQIGPYEQFISVIDDHIDKFNPLASLIDQSEHDYNIGGIFELSYLKVKDNVFRDIQIYIPNFEPSSLDVW